MSKTGYAGWTELEMDYIEDFAAEMLTNSLTRSFYQAGWTEEDVNSLSIKFTKASLTISDEEARTGAFHTLADGEPFYQMTVTGGNLMDVEAYATQYVLFMMQALKKCGMSMGTPLELTYDFRDLSEEMKTIKECSAAVVHHMKNESAAGKLKAKGAAPKGV